MKILMIYCDRFAYLPTIKTIDWVEEAVEGKELHKAQAAFIQMEEHDQTDEASTIKKLVNFVKWVARKNDCKSVILHSFAHLSESKAEPEFTFKIFNQTQIKLENAGYNVVQTPFGYFLNLDIQAPGFSMARVFKSF